MLTRLMLEQTDGIRRKEEQEKLHLQVSRLQDESIQLKGRVQQLERQMQGLCGKSLL